VVLNFAVLIWHRQRISWSDHDPGDREDRHAEEQQKQLVDRTLLKRWGRAEEVARLARFLLTDDSSFIVGEEIAIDGGRQLS
jgi:NAD(P)-dependent dehydrogenase (short-subunit alcohol dehydrogenase family)